MNHDTQLRLIDTVPDGQERAYLPGMGKRWLMPFYDVATRLGGIGRQHRRLIELADLRAGQRLLDVGCGTGNLLRAIARSTPGLELAGLDPDRDALTTAARKLRRTRASTTLFRGYADHLLFPDGSLDRVVSTLALHHLDRTAREGFAAEAFRALKPGGIITIMDFDGPASQSSRQPHRGRTHRHSSHGHGPRPGPGDSLVDLLRSAGFADAAEVDHDASRLGPISIVRAMRP